MKRRLAYSTIANLSYILLGVVMMTPQGMLGALTHMISHGIMKIEAFFCAGAIIHHSKKSYVYELDGLGQKMPVVFAALTISALGLMGVPMTAGFISKWNLARAAVESKNPMALAGLAILLISAFLTAIYMLPMVVRGYFPTEDSPQAMLEGVKDPGWQMVLPLVIIAVFIVGAGLFSTKLTEFLLALYQ